MLKERFHIKDLGRLSYFLGIHFELGDSFVMINQRRSSTKVLDRFEMSNSKQRATPSKQKLAFGSGTPCDRRYCEVVGSLAYATACTKPNTCCVVEKLESLCFFDHHTHFNTCAVIVLSCNHVL